MKTALLNIHDAILLLTLLEIIFLCIILLLVPAKNKKSRYLLVLFFALLFLVLGSSLIIWNSHFQTLLSSSGSLFPIILSAGLLLQGPALYLYLVSLSTDIVLFRWKNLFHLLPAIITSLTILVFHIDLIGWLPWNWSQLPLSSFVALQFVWAVFKCLPVIYVLACFYVECQLRRQLKQQFDRASFLELRWAEMILVGFFIHWLWACIAYFVSNFASRETNDLLGIIYNYFTVILVNFLFIFGLLNSKEFIISLPPTAEKKIDMAELSEKVQLIDNAIQLNKLHLNTQINLERFAEHIQIKPRELSAILNSHYQQNFFEFINGHRIQEAKHLLTSSDYLEESILDISHRAGFNSQSAFHRFFKRLEGITPSEYRKKMLEQHSNN